jgi:FkbM family methyltransferase
MKNYNLNHLLKNIKNGYFIQIGANDGVSNDEFGLKDILKNEDHTAILIEPIKSYYLELINNYKNFKSKLYFENIAITEKKEIKLLSLNGQDSSFVRPHDGDKIEVNCDTIESIFSKYNIKKINGLFIDVEGYEFNILNSLFSSKHPTIDFIRYEFWWSNDKGKLDDLLINNGYSVFQDEHSYADKIAIHNSILN